MDHLWWITMVELPVLSALFWFVMRTRKEVNEAMDRDRQRSDTDCARLRESFYAYKLEAAKTYVSQAHIRSIESRLIDHLSRIEAKLDDR